jgi:hypothetical protein
MSAVLNFMDSFFEGWSAVAMAEKIKERKLREKLSEKQVDEMVADSFPASDPPSTY